MSSENKDMPNPAMFREPSGESEKAAIATPLITNDKNLHTKTNNPNAFVMTVMDLVEPWLANRLTSAEELMSKFNERIRVNEMSEHGWSTENYVRVASAPLSLSEFKEAGDSRVGEGAKKK